MKLENDDFTLFGLPQRFAIDGPALDEQWRALQDAVHPDRFAAEGDAAKRVAMQWAVRVNEAYRRLKDPLNRAAYLCELRGAPPKAQDNMRAAPEFLTQQMEWRERLEQANDALAVDGLGEEVRAYEQQLFADLEVALDVRDDAQTASQIVRTLMFVSRFRQDVDNRMDAISP